MGRGGGDGVHGRIGELTDRVLRAQGGIMRENGWRRRAASYQRQARDRGQAATEYLGVVMLVAIVVVVVVVAAPGLGQRIGCEIERAATSAGSCSEDVEVTYAGEDGEGNPGDPAAPGSSEDGADGSAEYVHDGGGSSGSSDAPHYENSQLADEEADAEQVQQALEEVRDQLDGSWLFGVRQQHLDAARETIEGLDPAGIDALVAELSDEELADWVAEMEQGWLGGGWNAEERREFWELLASQVSRETFERLEEFTDDLVSRPDFENVGGDNASDDPGSVGNNAQYGEIPHVLFEDDGPNPADANQGAIGDCWWIASIMAAANGNPELIESAIAENPNGTYTVTLYEDGDPVEIVVTPEMVLDNGDGTPAFVDNNPRGSGDYVLWPMVMEKAMAIHMGADYSEIEGGSTYEGFEYLTGQTATQNENLSDVSIEELAQVLDDGAAGLSTLRDQAAKDSGFYDQGSFDTPGNDRLRTHHAYYVSEVNVETGEVTVVNPHGLNEDQQPIVMSYDDFTNAFRRMDVSELGR